MGATLFTHLTPPLFLFYVLTHLCFPKGTNKDSSLFPHCTWFHLQKSNLSLQKNIFSCSTESSLNFSYYTVSYFLCSALFDLLKLAEKSLLRKLGFLSLLSQGLKAQTDSSSSFVVQA